MTSRSLAARGCCRLLLVTGWEQVVAKQQHLQLHGSRAGARSVKDLSDGNAVPPHSACVAWWGTVVEAPKCKHRKP